MLTILTRRIAGRRRWAWASFHPTIRHFASQTINLDSNEYTTALYSKLSRQEQYQFLDNKVPLSDLALKDNQLAASNAFKEFLAILIKDSVDSQEQNMISIQADFSEKFTSWSRLSRLKIGFLMYLDSRIQADPYLLKVIKHMCSGNIYDVGPHDLTALMLLIYFKRDLTVEQLSEFIDVELLCGAFAAMIRNQKLTKDEVCACCLGLKRISGLSVTNLPLRKELYRKLQTFRMSEPPDKLDDFFLVTLMTTLQRGNLVFKDEPEEVNKMIQNLQSSLEEVKLETCLKIMCYSLSLNFTNRKVGHIGLARVQKELDQVTMKDLCNLASYVSKCKHPEAKEFAPSLMKQLETSCGPGSIHNLQDLIDLVDAFHYLSHTNTYSIKFNRALFQALASLPTQLTQGVSIPEVSRDVACSLSKNLGLSLDLSKDWVSDNKHISVFSRVASFICSSYKLESGEPVDEVSPSVLFALSSHSHETLPMQLYSPMMGLRGLKARHRLLVNCYRGMTKFLGNEQFCRVVRILPHFDEPDIVFGNIGGICMSVPSYLWEPGTLGPRKPPPGDWHVIVIGMQKSLTPDRQVIGQDAAKLSQLRKLGYTPYVVPHHDLGAPGGAMSALSKVLTSADIKLPNLDDGAHEKYRRF